MAKPRHRVGEGLLRLALWGTVALCVAVVVLYLASFRWRGAFLVPTLSRGTWAIYLERGWILAGRRPDTWAELNPLYRVRPPPPFGGWHRIERGRP